MAVSLLQRQRGPASGRRLGLVGAAAIGVGGMVGGGLFSVLGLAVEVAGSGAYAAFALGGVAALLTGYSYAKLAVRFPSSGGTVDFLNEGFRGKYVPGSLNLLLWLGYVVMIALYASGLASYLCGVLGVDPGGPWRHILASAALVAFAVLNAFDAKIVGRTQSFLVYVTLAALAAFVAGGALSTAGGRVSPDTFPGTGSVIFAGSLVFLAYEGFELIANAAEEMRSPERTLPLATYGSIGCAIAIYVAVAFVATGSLGVDGIWDRSELAVAAAAETFWGRAGFMVMAVVAVLSTASALNATLFATPRFTVEMARSDELPQGFLGRVRGRPLIGLAVTTALTLLLVNLVDIESISLMGSAVFLLIFAATNLANLRLASETGASRALAGLGTVVCIGSLAALVAHAATTSPSLLLVLAGMLAAAIGVEVGYQARRGP